VVKIDSILLLQGKKTFTLPHINVYQAGNFTNLMAQSANARVVILSAGSHFELFSFTNKIAPNFTITNN
jgi:hypothetical protein